MGAGGAYVAYRAVAGNFEPNQRQIRIAFTISRPPEEVYNFVRDRQNWSRFIQGAQLKSEDARLLSLTWGKRMGFRGSCEAEITDEQPGQYIAWTSRPGSVDHRGVLHFRAAPGDRGTEISIEWKSGRLALRSAGHGHYYRANVAFVATISNLDPMGVWIV